ncbi:6383_t:CDS:2, partial [Racocetra fulgida]
MRAVENIIQERRLLEEIEYPLVCNLRYAFQDDENLFMVLDLMLGGDLRFHLERQACMREDVVKFYVAEVSLGLNYLHSKKIVHRDLKPDNVLLDEKGHAHLTDFNIAVHFNERKPLTSVAGSMAYMAILHEPLQFPDNVYDLVSRECIDCLKRFCERDISKRLGCGPNGLEDIKRHPWFRDIEWDKLDTKQAKAPFIPDVCHIISLEELLLEDNPLKAKKRANPNQDLSELSKEMRMMEEKFLIYDFTKMARRSYFVNPPERSTRRRSERSSGSTTVDRMMNNYSGATIQLDNIDSTDTSNLTSNLQHPSMVKLQHARTESDLTA